MFSMQAQPQEMDDEGDDEEQDLLTDTESPTVLRQQLATEMGTTYLTHEPCEPSPGIYYTIYVIRDKSVQEN